MTGVIQFDFLRMSNQRYFFVAAAWVDPGGAPFSQLSSGVKDAMVVSVWGLSWRAGEVKVSAC